jgi:hypothetical protein
MRRMQVVAADSGDAIGPTYSAMRMCQSLIEARFSGWAGGIGPSFFAGLWCPMLVDIEPGIKEYPRIERVGSA